MRIWLCFFVLHLVLPIVACGQKTGTQVTDPDELKVKFQSVAKKGGVQMSRLPLSDVPNTIPFPPGHELLSKGVYEIKTEVIDLGRPVYSIKLDIQDKVDFDDAAILILRKDERRPVGYAWQDCTIREGEQRPSFDTRYISCESDGATAAEYVVAVRSPKFSDLPDLRHIAVTVDSAVESGATITYKVSVKNVGNREIGELNLHSVFDDDLNFVKSTPSQGACRASPFGNTHGSSVCHLGPVAANDTITIEFVGKVSGRPGSIYPPDPHGPKNRPWVITLYPVDVPGGVLRTRNSFGVQPLMPERN